MTSRKLLNLDMKLDRNSAYWMEQIQISYTSDSLPQYKLFSDILCV